MRYILQVMVMLGDIATLGMCALMVYLMWSISNHSFILDVLIIAALIRWYKTGNIEAWRPSKIRQFMKNARRYNL
jgi:hypothetical protein